MMMRHRVLLATAALTIAAAGASMAADFWIKEVNQDCSVWSDEPAVEGDIISWSGKCIANKVAGTGVLVWLRDGVLFARYDGDMTGGKVNGQGALIIRSEGSQTFEVIRGSFRDGQPHGRVTYMGADHALFEGTFVEGVKHGPGFFADASGNSFQGIFVNDKASGPGRSASADGEEYFGQFEDNERHGNGVLIDADGGIYTGQFRVGLAEGLGIYESSAGVFEGRFANNTPNGHGSFVSADGVIYQGQFLDGEPDGLVVVTAKDGSQTIETWANGEKVK